jgi:hypothetical protein
MAIKVGGTTVIDDSRNISNITNLATVATSGAYADITGTPSSAELLPSQTGNATFYLTTDGTTATWAAVATGGALFDGNLFQ